MKTVIRVPLAKPRNPHVKELFDDTYKGGRHEPKKERFKPNYEALVEEEQNLLDDLDAQQSEDEAEQNWRDYLASQNINTQGGEVTPENE